MEIRLRREIFWLYLGKHRLGPGGGRWTSLVVEREGGGVIKRPVNWKFHIKESSLTEGQMNKNMNTKNIAHKIQQSVKNAHFSAKLGVECMDLSILEKNEVEQLMPASAKYLRI